MNLTEKRRFTVTAEMAGCRLDKLLLQLTDIHSRSKAAKLIQSGLVLVNGKAAKSSLVVAPGDIIDFEEVVEKKSVGIIENPIPLHIVYEDNDLLVVNKPAGLVVHPATSHQTDTLVNALLAHTKDLSMGVNEERPGIVHRLDKDTSGLIVVAKNDQSHFHLAEQFKSKSIHRRYWAIIFGKMPEDRGTIRSNLARHPQNRKKFASCAETSGKNAVTHYRQIQIAKNGLSFVELALETGRTHQIRVHLSEKGHPIVGDELYGGIKPAKNLKSVELRHLINQMNRFALHAAELGFIHPTWKKPLLFSIGWPDNLIPLVEACGFTTP